MARFVWKTIMVVPGGTGRKKEAFGLKYGLMNLSDWKVRG